jgi:hypothetical protein
VPLLRSLHDEDVFISVVNDPKEVTPVLTAKVTVPEPRFKSEKSMEVLVTALGKSVSRFVPVSNVNVVSAATYRRIRDVSIVAVSVEDAATLL